MTKDEAIRRLNNLLKSREDKRGKTEIDVALEMGIDALEFNIDKWCEEHGYVLVDNDVWKDAEKALVQDPKILDKIRAEIEQLRNFRAEDYDLEQYCDYFDSRIIFRDDVIKIIDKYRAESEEE